MAKDETQGFQHVADVDVRGLSLATLRRKNMERQAKWPGSEHITGLFRAVEMGGEVGEALNMVKKLARLTDGIAGNTEDKIALYSGLADELADIIVTADLLAEWYGIDLSRAVADKFNKTSAKNDISVSMPRHGQRHQFLVNMGVSPHSYHDVVDWKSSMQDAPKDQRFLGLGVFKRDPVINMEAPCDVKLTQYIEWDEQKQAYVDQLDDQYVTLVGSPYFAWAFIPEDDDA